MWVIFYVSEYQAGPKPILLGLCMAWAAYFMLGAHPILFYVHVEIVMEEAKWNRNDKCFMKPILLCLTTE